MEELIFQCTQTTAYPWLYLGWSASTTYSRFTSGRDSHVLPFLKYLVFPLALMGKQDGEGVLRSGRQRRWKELETVIL